LVGVVGRLKPVANVGSRRNSGAQSDTLVYMPPQFGKPIIPAQPFVPDACLCAGGLLLVIGVLAAVAGLLLWFRRKR
jgi:hypothetical protein